MLPLTSTMYCLSATPLSPACGKFWILNWGFVADYFTPKYCIWVNWHIKGMVVDYFVQNRQILNSFELRKGLIVDYFTWHRQTGLRQRGGRVSHCQDRPGQRSQLGTITVLSLTSRFFESQPEWHLDSSWNLGQLFLWPLIPGQHRSDFFMKSDFRFCANSSMCATWSPEQKLKVKLSWLVMLKWLAAQAQRPPGDFKPVKFSYQMNKGYMSFTNVFSGGLVQDS